MMNSHPDVIPFPQRAVAPAAETAPNVLIVTCDPEVAWRLENDVRSAGLSSRIVNSFDAAAQSLSLQACEVCLAGPLAPGETAGALAGLIQQKGWSTQLICLIAAPSEDAPQILPAANGIELLTQPYAPSTFSLTLSSACQRSRLMAENRRLKRQLSNRNLRDMVGHSPAMHNLRQQVQNISDHNACVLIQGEPGSGTDLVAQAIHDSGRRAHRPFVKIDCSVLSAETLEQDLFGQCESAPMGQTIRHAGRLELADGGTLLLEQVQFVALPVQKLIATLIREQCFVHPQTDERIRFDVRFVFGANTDLTSLVDRGLFRRDLYELATQSCVELPTLRSRKDDIAPLTEHFLRRIAGREGKPPRSLTLDALHVLQRHDWPGNVCELENVIERACALDWGSKLSAAMIEPWLTPREVTEEEADALPGLTLAEMERKLIEATFNRFAGNREKTAKALQIGIRTLSGKLREYGYPPRGGPGSNLKAWTPSPTIAPASLDSIEHEQRAA
jgi:DNA-binding NtrC family response regulator